MIYGSCWGFFGGKAYDGEPQFTTPPISVEPDPAVEIGARALEAGSILTPVASGYGTDVWLPMRDGRLLLLADSDGGVKISAELDIGPGLGLPLVTPDGSVWIGSAGRINRVQPELGPDSYELGGA